MFLDIIPILTENVVVALFYGNAVLTFQKRKFRYSLRSSVVFFVFLGFFVRYGLAAVRGMGLLAVGP